MKRVSIAAVLVAMAVLQGCATTNQEPIARTAKPHRDALAYIPAGDEGLLERFAPVFVVEQSDESYNRIGTPAARRANDVYVDPSHPSIYTDTSTFTGENGRYTNLYYRVHFEESPFTWKPLNVSAGKNVGIMAIVTLDEQERPVLFTTVHTCGCYHAVVPTNYLPNDVYPPEWDPTGFEVYGEHMPGMLRYPEPIDADFRPVVTIRPGTHRVMDVAVRPVDALDGRMTTTEATLSPVSDLRHLALEDGGETSFFYQEGRRKGLVRGAYKPLETLFFGALIQDAHVGQDRRFGPKDETGRLFYTTLNPLKKEASDMSDFQQFLKLNGWRS